MSYDIRFKYFTLESALFTQNIKINKKQFTNIFGLTDTSESQLKPFTVYLTCQ